MNVQTHTSPAPDLQRDSLAANTSQVITGQAMTGRAILNHCLGDAAIHWPEARGQLMMGGEPLSDWLKAHATPAYLYNLDVISAQVHAVRAILPSPIQLHYAIKANPHPAIIAHLANSVDGFDCASLQEMQRVAELAPALLCHTSMAGPAKSLAELKFSIENNVLINVESLGELERIQSLCQRTHPRARVALRINPPFELKGSGMKMGGGARPFGIDSEQIPAIIHLIQTDDTFREVIDLEGFHLYIGSQNRDAAAINAGLAASLNLIEQLCSDTGYTPRHLNLGGGFGVVYHPKDTPLDLTALQPALGEIATRAQSLWPNIRLNLELGRYLVASAGMYLTRIVERKISRGKTYLLCDGGMHHHLALSGNLGQVLRRNWPIIGIDQLNQPHTDTVDIAGPLCTPLDVLGQSQPVPPLTLGDVIGVLQSGAYGLTASPNGFLSHPACEEYFFKRGLSHAP
ncbi:MAG: alanine racemase [Halothiobacillus sp.]